MHHIDDHNDFSKLLFELQKQIGGTLVADVYTFPTAIAVGTIRVVTLMGNIQVSISQYETRTKITMQKLTHLPEMYTLRFNYLQKNNDLTIQIDDTTIEDKSQNYAAILLTTSKLPLLYTTEANTIVNSINIKFSPAILDSYFNNLDIKKYVLEMFNAKVAMYHFVPMNFSCRQALLEAILMPSKTPFYILSLRTRLFELTDYFFKQYFNKVEEQMQPTNTKVQSDIEALSELDMAITESFDKELPKLEDIAKTVFMSEAKFKTLFKKLYGQSFYDYYNTSKLNKARKEIMSGKYSIKEVAYKYGYNDVANFSTAFKKCFHFSPSEIKLLN
jgi:AraC-like DNA-binding protein